MCLEAGLQSHLEGVEGLEVVPARRRERFEAYLKPVEGGFIIKRDVHFQNVFKSGQRPALGVDMWQLIGEGSIDIGKRVVGEAIDAARYLSGRLTGEGAAVFEGNRGAREGKVAPGKPAGAGSRSSTSMTSRRCSSPRS